jgi:class 3 adenylate cyclase
MDFVTVVDQAIALLRQRGRVTYRTLKRQFQLDDTALEDLTVELIKGQRLAADEDGEVLVWIGNPPSSPASAAAAPTPAPVGYTPPYLAEKILTSRRALEGERKQVTVLFADLKDSTRLIEGLDPEAARQLLDPALHLMMDAVHRYEGTVNQVLGDGIMALFGAPIAHEDYALRACYAAMAMQATLRRYSDDVRRAQGLTLQTRVGLNSGEVVVRTISNDLHMDYSAVGQTVHLAARMEQLATPGTILLTAATLRLVEGLVQVHPLGSMPVKGLTEPVEAYELLGASALRRRLQVAAARGLTRFVGRQHELDTLSQTLEQARTGHGQVVALGRGSGGWQVSVGVRGRAFPPHAGLAGARERLGVVWQSHGLLPGHRPPQALRPRRGRRRYPHHPRQGHRSGADARRGPPGGAAGIARAPGRPAGRQPLPDA